MGGLTMHALHKSIGGMNIKKNFQIYAFQNIQKIIQFINLIIGNDFLITTIITCTTPMPPALAMFPMQSSANTKSNSKYEEIWQNIARAQ